MIYIKESGLRKQNKMASPKKFQFNFKKYMQLRKELSIGGQGRKNLHLKD
jgi:hypothetical protein